jgi:hypothetical protein
MATHWYAHTRYALLLLVIGLFAVLLLCYVYNSTLPFSV